MKDEVRGWLPIRPFHSGARLLAYLLVMCFALTSNSWADSKIKLLQYGTWGLSIDRDPFKGLFPAVIYIPPGTIVFDSKKGSIQNYYAVQLQYGHWVQIPKTQLIAGKAVDVITSIDGLVKPPPSNTILVHRSILCLGQTNRFAYPPDKCRQVGDHPDSTMPVVKGWIYTFETNNTKPEWLDLSARLNQRTKTELEQRGLLPAEANFEARRIDLLEAEKKGYVTMLDKKHPFAVFEYQTRRPIFIKCGQNKVTQKGIIRRCLGIYVITIKSKNTQGELHWLTKKV